MRRAALLVLAAALATACGTTVPISQQSSALGSDQSGLGGDVVSGTTGSALPSGTTGTTGGTTGTTALPGGSSGSVVPGSTSTTTTGAKAPTSVPTSAIPKSTAPVKVGVLYIEGADQAAAALGIGLTTGDTKAQAKAIIAALNTQGGLAGRTITPVLYGMNASDLSSNPSGVYQAACTSLAQDSKVAFVVSYVNPLASAIACFAKAKIPFLDDQSLLADAVQKQYAASFSAPGDFAPGRLMKNLVDGLWAQGWLTPKSKVGSYTFDTKENIALVESALVPALAAHGLTIVKKAAVSSSVSGVSQSSNASLQYRTAGVDRIIPVSANPLFVMQAASSQGYHPRYALYSSIGPGALLESAAPKDQLAGAAGIGWQPFLDIGAGTKPGPVSANETRCFAIMKAAGQASSSATVKGLQASLCDVLFFLKAAADKVGGAPFDVIRRASPLIGTTFPSANTFRSDVSKRVDGAAGYRDLAYQQDCGCFQYVSGIHPAA
jgi:hypothetical protein